MEKRSIRLQEIMAAVFSDFFIRFLSGGGCSGHRLFFLHLQVVFSPGLTRLFFALFALARYRAKQSSLSV